MRQLLGVVLFTLVTCYSYAQVFELPDSLNNASYLRTLHYLETEISKQKVWNEEKINLTLCKSFWLTKNWEYDLALDVFNTIPSAASKLKGTAGTYFLTHAILLKYKNEPEFSLSKFRSAIAFFKIHSVEKECYARIELAEFYRKIGQLDFGLEELRRVELIIGLLNSSKTSNLYLNFLNRKAAILNESAFPQKSIEVSRLCIRYAKRANNKLIWAISSNELGFSYKNMRTNRQKNLDTCINYYKQSEKLFRELGLTCEALQLKYNWITAYSHNRQQPDKVIQGYKEIIAEVNEKKIPFALQDVYLNLFTEFKIKGDLENALEFYKLYSDVTIELLQNQKVEELQKVKDEYRAYQLAAENKIIKKENLQKDFEMKSQSQKYFLFILILVIFVLSLYFLYRKNLKLSGSLIVKNKEKDLLIQEVHHRVKNNMHFISTLLEMQQDSSKSVHESIVLQDANVRIASMSLVHEMLYQDDSMSEVLLSSYIEKLIDLLKDSFNIQASEVKIQIQVEPIFVSTLQATAIGLIINEFFSNSVKHAFFKTEEPEFHLETKTLKESGEIRLEMWDNGPGVPGGIDGSNSFGVKLIRLLTSQINAKGIWETEGKLYYSLTAKL